MNFIENAWETVRKSYAVWLGWLVGFLGSWMAFIASDLFSEQDKINFHVAAQLHYIPILIGFIGLFGIGVARAVKQQNLPLK